jgi:hypothetical protein
MYGLIGILYSVKEKAYNYFQDYVNRIQTEEQKKTSTSYYWG